MDRAVSRSIGARWAGLVLGVAVLAACAGPPVEEPGGTGEDPDAITASSLPTCEEPPSISADPALYRDEPVYGNAMELVEQVRVWAEARPGFEEIWFDRERNGWIHVGFHGEVDVAALQAALAQQFPGEGVVAVEVPYSSAELQALAEDVVGALDEVGVRAPGYAASVTTGRASVFDVPATPEVLEVVERFAGDPVCVGLVALDDIVPEGPQPEGGEGWRLLAHADGVGEVYRTGVATTDEQLAGLWAASGLGGAAPEVDWQQEVVVWFGATESGSCPARLDDVVVSGATLHGGFVIPGPPQGCTDDANPHAYVVAVERERLPEGPFVVQLDADDPPAGAPEERTVVDVDLSAPGATATDEQLHADATAGAATAPFVEDGHEGMPPSGAVYVFHARPDCDHVVIGPFDGSLWRLADLEAPWVAADGEELTLFALDESSILTSGSGGEHAFVRLPEGTCAG